MFSADAEFQSRTRFATTLGCNSHELTDPFDVDRDESISRVNALVEVVREKHSGIVSADSVCRLRKIVCPERIDLRVFRYLFGQERRARQFDHRSSQIFRDFSALSPDLLR